MLSYSRVSLTRSGGIFNAPDFPLAPRRVRRLLSRDFVDTSPVAIDGTWYFFTTSPRGLEIFFTDDLEAGELHPHPNNPITDDPRFRRCGGIPLRVDGRLVRWAQDCSERYGGNLNLLTIEELTQTSYRESLWHEHVIGSDEPWNRLGGHHMSAVAFKGRLAVAVDGQAHETYPASSPGSSRRWLCIEAADRRPGAWNSGYPAPSRSPP